MCVSASFPVFPSEPKRFDGGFAVCDNSQNVVQVYAHVREKDGEQFRWVTLVRRRYVPRPKETFVLRAKVTP